MSEVSAALVSELREKTGAGMMDCKQALGESQRRHREGRRRAAREGPCGSGQEGRRAWPAKASVGSYIHAGGKIGVLDRGQLRDRLRRPHGRVPGLGEGTGDAGRRRRPRYVSREEVPADVLETRTRASTARRRRSSGKPAAVIEKIVDGKIEKFYADVCLLEQAFIKEPQKPVRQLVTDAIAQLGENVVGAALRALPARGGVRGRRSEPVGERPRPRHDSPAASPAGAATTGACC